MDPRYFQIAFLLGLLIFGFGARDFSISGQTIAAVLGTALTSQFLAIRLLRLPVKSLLSALVSGISMLLLCRSHSVTYLILAVVLAVASKFIFRWRGKHFFNPTNFGIVTLLLFTGKVWVSPGQWGTDTLLFFWLVALGATVAQKSERSDISLTFLGVYSLLLFSRVSYLGQPLSVFFHQLQSGSLLLFIFFMISDPRSTPDHRIGRVLFATLLAFFAYWLRFQLYNPNAPLLALFFLSPITLLLDSLWKHCRFEWQKGTPLYVAPSPFVTFCFQVSQRLLRFLRGEGRRQSF